MVKLNEIDDSFWPEDADPKNRQWFITASKSLATWSLEPRGTPAWEFVHRLNRVWQGGRTLAQKLKDIRPFLPADTFKKAVYAASLRHARVLPPLMYFAADLLVPLTDGDHLEIVLPIVGVSLWVPAPPDGIQKAPLLVIYLNPPLTYGPMRVLSTFRSPYRQVQKSRSLAAAMCQVRRRPHQALRRLCSLLLNQHPEDLGALGPWNDATLTGYLAAVAELVQNDALLVASVQKALGSHRRITCPSTKTDQQ